MGSVRRDVGGGKVHRRRSQETVDPPPHFTASVRPASSSAGRSEADWDNASVFLVCSLGLTVAISFVCRKNRNSALASHAVFLFSSQSHSGLLYSASYDRRALTNGYFERYGSVMMIALKQSERSASVAKPQAYRRVCDVFFAFLKIVALTTLILPGIARAAEPSKTEAATEKQLHTLIPDIEPYVVSGMKVFDVPGLAIGNVAGDKLVYAKGFGVRSKTNGLLVDTRTVFQIGSTTKAFLAVTEAIMVDRGKLGWDDRVVDLDPEFQLKDRWVRREFRVFDLLAQRSSLPAKPGGCCPSCSG